MCTLEVELICFSAPNTGLHLHTCWYELEFHSGVQTEAVMLPQKGLAGNLTVQAHIYFNGLKLTGIRLNLPPYGRCQ